MADLTVMVKEDITRYSGRFYESLWWPRFRNFHFYQRDDYEGDKEPLWWKIKPLNWLVRCWHSILDYIRLDICKDWLFSRLNWDADIMPSFPDAFKKLWNNILMFLTPWYCMRGRFINAFINCNGSKLLDNKRNWAYVRNRQSECAYYTLTFCGFHYELTKKVTRDDSGKAINQFIKGITIAFSADKTNEEKLKEAESLKEEITKVCSGWVFGINSSVKELNKIAKLTQDLEWESPTKWEQEHPNYLAELEAEMVACVEQAQAIKEEAKAEIKIESDKQEE